MHERGDGGADLVALDLGDETGGHTDAVGEPALRHAALLAQIAQLGADIQLAAALGLTETDDAVLYFIESGLVKAAGEPAFNLVGLEVKH